MSVHVLVTAGKQRNSFISCPCSMSYRRRANAENMEAESQTALSRMGEVAGT